jgi:hypothetical protein
MEKYTISPSTHNWTDLTSSFRWRGRRRNGNDSNGTRQRLSSCIPPVNSAQRLETSIPRIPTDSQLMPPPPVPSLSVRQPSVPLSSRRSSTSTLAVPPSTTRPPVKRRENNLLHIPPSIFKQHNKRNDAWTAIYGKVYNITTYLPFHPGGLKELMSAAGRDGPKFSDSTFYRPFSVNVDFMLDARYHICRRRKPSWLIYTVVWRSYESNKNMKEWTVINDSGMENACAKR